MGHHTFRYALMPHAGSLQQAGIVQEGYRFNVPLLIWRTSANPSETSFFSIDQPSVVIDTIKKAEDSDSIILRLYEAHGVQATARLSSSLPVTSAARCNLLEIEDQQVEWADGGATFHIRPFQILTLKLNLAG